MNEGQPKLEGQRPALRVDRSPIPAVYDSWNNKIYQNKTKQKTETKNVECFIIRVILQLLPQQ